MKHPQALAGIAISLVCGYLAVRGVEWSAVWAAMGRVSLLALLEAMACLGVLFLLRAYRWQRFVEPLQPLPLWPFFSATLIGSSSTPTSAHDCGARTMYSGSST